jgi:3-deoxy-D-manno-octulosonate 8-phosphate phosphatase (KDO 8-P phosphatase)
MTPTSSDKPQAPKTAKAAKTENAFKTSKTSAPESPSDLTGSLSRIRWVGFDVDGVMTDGGIVLAADGTESKRFNSRDGHALKLLVRSGIKVAIITGRRSRVVELRALEVGITELHQAASDKLAVYRSVLEAEGLTPEETAFAGDDMVDLPIMIRAGLSMAPSDAAPEVLARARFITRSRGGHGAVREMVEYLLRGQGLWDRIMDGYTERRLDL